MKLKNFFLLLVMVSLTLPVVFTACTPKYSVEAVDKTKEAWSATDDLYEKMIKSPDKSYKTYGGDYDIIQAKIGIIELLDISRKKSKAITKSIVEIDNRFAKYKAEHEAAGSINNTQITLYKQNMDDLWRHYYNDEIHLNK